jgi:thiol-disulfide isomerase/thioredoxin
VKFVAATLVLAVLLLTGCTKQPATAATGMQTFAPADRKAAPALQGENLDGAALDLATQGQVVVVNFWASWCGPCTVEADDLEGTYQATKSTGVTFVGVDTRDQREDAKRFVVGRATYPSLFDPAGKLALRFAVPPTSIPSTIVIDRQGRIAAMIRGAVLREDLEPVVTRIAAEAT